MTVYLWDAHRISRFCLAVISYPARKSFYKKNTKHIYQAKPCSKAKAVCKMKNGAFFNLQTGVQDVLRI